MSSFLPREWGESGALRVSDTSSRPAPERVRVNRDLQEWLRSQSNHNLIDIKARKLREDNLRKVATSRHVRQSRVS